MADPTIHDRLDAMREQLRLMHMTVEDSMIERFRRAAATPSWDRLAELKAELKRIEKRIAKLTAKDREK